MTVQEFVTGKGASCTIPLFVSNVFILHWFISNISEERRRADRFGGALCGAIFVEERFRELVVKKLIEISADAMKRVTDEEMQEIMTRDWEEKIRNQFNGAARTWTIRYPFSLIDRDRLDPNRGYPTFTITSEEVGEVFRPSVERIEWLVNCQIGAAVEKNGNLPKV